MKAKGLNIGVIGCGYWGPNLVRNFFQIPRVERVKVCDIRPERLEYIKTQFKGLETTNNFKNIIQDKDVDAVCVATPVGTHYELTREALLHGKHVFVEKPLARTCAQAGELKGMAESRGLVLFVGHTFLYSQPVMRMKEMIDSDDLGRILYINSVRVNLGLFQKDINVIWDLAPHDISIINFLTGALPDRIIATGASHIYRDVEDVAFLVLHYPQNIQAYIHLSWLDPNKIRRMTMVCDKRMVVYDDLDLDQPLKCFDKGVDQQPRYNGFGEFKMLYRFGDMHAPRIEPHEPLKEECRDFVRCIIEGGYSPNNATAGVEVVRIIEAAQASLKGAGKQVELRWR